jgi:hypothetical protein
VRSLLWRTARASVDRFGARASVSLGAVAPGALGDEVPYASPDELADDVAIVRAAGIEDVALFDLGGVVRRGPMDAWLDALVDTPPALHPPAATLRARAAESLAVGRPALFEAAGVGGHDESLDWHVLATRRPGLRGAALDARQRLADRRGCDASILRARLRAARARAVRRRARGCRGRLETSANACPRGSAHGEAGAPVAWPEVGPSVADLRAT